MVRGNTLLSAIPFPQPLLFKPSTFTQVLAKRAGSLGGALMVGDPNMPEYNGTRLLKLNGERQEAIIQLRSS